MGKIVLRCSVLPPPHMLSTQRIKCIFVKEEEAFKEDGGCSLNLEFDWHSKTSYVWLAQGT